MDTRERVRDIIREVSDDSGYYEATLPNKELDDFADDIMRVVDEERAELVKALEPFATWRCKDPIRKEVVPTKYKSETLLYDCGKCKTCKARAVIAKATGK